MVAMNLLLGPKFKGMIISDLHYYNLSRFMSAYLFKGLMNIFKPLKKNILQNIIPEGFSTHIDIMEQIVIPS